MTDQRILSLQLIFEAKCFGKNASRLLFYLLKLVWPFFKLDHMVLDFRSKMWFAQRLSAKISQPSQLNKQASHPQATCEIIQQFLWLSFNALWTLRTKMWSRFQGKADASTTNVPICCVAVCCISDRNDVTMSYLWLWVVSFAAPAWIRTVVRRCNFPRHPPPPQVSRHVWCWLWWSSSIQPSHTPGRRQRLISHKRTTGSTAAPKCFCSDRTLYQVICGCLYGAK